MKKPSPKVYTITPGKDFLHVLAQAILDGFPLKHDEKHPPLSKWTILVPTRRAARELSLILAERYGRSALLMPSIKPIGDLEELYDIENRGHLPPALSPTAQIFMLLDLLEEWANANPHIELAQEITASPHQRFNLAVSLQQLINQVETEETQFDRLSDAYNEDLSEHRNTILSLLSLVKEALPRKLIEENKLGHAERRSRMIRLEAQRVADGFWKGPIIAAGSTGTIPATRALLKAIALHPQGAVILPGLDQIADDYYWENIEPDHPQFSLKTLVETLGVLRSEIPTLGPSTSDRHWLTSELMRPSATAEKWQETLLNKQTNILAATDGLTCLEAPHRHQEARSIAIILREALEIPGQTAALITPDRDLAKRVKTELQRWNILIDDSAGEPLAQFGVADLTMRILNGVKENFSTASLLNILLHHDCDFGLGREPYLKLLKQFEVAVLRGYGSDTGLHGIETAFTRAFQSYKSKVRVHPLVARLNEDDWLGLHRLTLQIISVFTPLTEKSKCPLADQLRRIGFCLKSLAPNVDFSRPENQAYAEIIYEIESEAHRHPVCGLDAAIAILSHALHGTPFRGSGANQHRIAIYGVLEARLLPIDIVVLGGLNEGKWPAQPDPGPWLNRSMRKIFGLQQPEREIGVSAHDFAQGIGYQKTYLTWSRRIEGAPQIPSRWVLRLQTVLKATGIEPESIQKNWWTHLAAQIDAPKESIPLGKPKPKPPTKARPTKFSVSMVEKLIRDPYAIYASKILKLEPLPKLGADADGALRGTLFHQAINQWNNQVKGLSQTLSLQTLLSEGRIVFEPFKNDPEINRFWWTKFEQMAQWLVLQEKDFSENLIDTYPEMTGSINFDVGGVAHILSARADRIDRLRGGGGRIIDYKTGKPPSKAQVTSGIAPQLPLEAVILEQGGYLDLGALTCLEMLYLKINGAGEGGELISIEDKDKSLNDIGRHHFEHFKMLLQDYQNPEQAYYPRQNVKLEDEANDYDHLSRYAEWVLAGRV